MILRVLFVEDSENDAALILREVKRLGYEVESQRVQTAEAMQAALTDKEWDIILCDYSLPSFNGSRALDVLKASGKDLPFIILSGTVGEEILADVMNSGAQDFLLKDHLARLGPVLHRELEESKARQEHRQAERALKDSELKYRRLFESAKDGILILDYETGTIVDINPFLLQLLGLKQEEILGKKIWDLGFFKDIAADQAKFLELQKQEFIRYDDLPLEDANGQSRRVEFVSNVYWVNSHKVIQCNIRDITERKQLDAEVKSLSNFPEENPDPVLRLNEQGNILYANRAGQAVLEGWKTAVGQNAPAFWWTEMAKAFETRSRQSIELSLGARVFSFTIAPVLDAGYVNLYGSDITERKHAEAALQKSEEKFREIFNNANDAIYLWNLDEGGTILKGVEVNEVACKRMGYSKEEFLLLSPADINAGNIGEKLPVMLAPLLSQGQMLTEAFHRTKDGRIIPVEISSCIIELMGEKKILSLARDITERKQAEESLRYSESRFRQMANSLPELVWTCQPDGKCDFLSQQWMDFTGIPEEPQLGFGWLDQLHPEDRQPTVAEWEKAFNSDMDFHVEFRIRRHDGVYRWFDTQAVRARDESGRTIKWFGSSSDITERKEAEEKLRVVVDELERSNKELEQFAYVASHDLQEPLRMVSSYMQLIAKRYQGKLDSNADEFIAYAVDGALRMQRMINDLLTFSRVGRRGKPFQSVDTEAVLIAALENLKLAIEDSHAAVTHDPLPNVLADESQLAQLFQNLIGNALKFHGEEPPRVQVSARKTNSPHVVASVANAVSEAKQSPAMQEEIASPKALAMTPLWEFSVRDNGIGIDPQFFERVFLIFQRLSTRAEHAGSGIGLAICKKIVERHGGRIWIESKLGQGTTFFFTLPGA